MNLDLQSERLLLRPLVAADADLGAEIWTDPEVMKYAGGVWSTDQILCNMLKYTRRGAGGCIGTWCVTDRAANDKLGTAILLPLPVEEDDTNWNLVVGDALPDCEIEIGYILKRSAWGKGYATEATKRLLKFAFEQTPIEELVATIDPENSASRRVLEKCGLISEGMRRAYAVECPGFRITRQQWLERSQIES